jgi:hypothetical protein
MYVWPPAAAPVRVLLARRLVREVPRSAVAVVEAVVVGERRVSGTVDVCLRRRGRSTKMVFYFFMCSAILYADNRNNSSWCLYRRLPRPQNGGTPSNSTRHTRHLGGHPSKYQPGPSWLTLVIKWVLVCPTCRVFKNRLKYDLKSNQIICRKYDLKSQSNRHFQKWFKIKIKSNHFTKWQIILVFFARLSTCIIILKIFKTFPKKKIDF